MSQWPGKYVGIRNTQVTDKFSSALEWRNPIMLPKYRYDAFCGYRWRTNRIDE